MPENKPSAGFGIEKKIPRAPRERDRAGLEALNRAVAPRLEKISQDVLRGDLGHPRVGRDRGLKAAKQRCWAISAPWQNVPLLAGALCFPVIEQIQRLGTACMEKRGTGAPRQFANSTKTKA